MKAMMNKFLSYEFLTKFTGFISPEMLHNLFLISLKYNLFKKKKKFSNLKINLLGKEFENPVGLAAGFDKNGEAIDGCLNLGFGYVEVGTITPMPQYGNAKPRVFKIPEYQAIIQRLGFNNLGVENLIDNIEKLDKKERIFGVNIGRNKNSPDNFNDYLFLYKIVQEYSDYVTINISSPNTPGLRDLQKPSNIKILLNKLLKIKKKTTFVKLSPDLDDEELKEICSIILKTKFVDGLILTNTTISRKNLNSKQIRNFWKADESGGLSGPPLKKLSNDIIKKTYKFTKGKILLIGVGGISSGRDVFEKISLGCSLVQLYTSLVFRGPGFIIKILEELSEILKKGIANIKDLIGTNEKI